MDWNTRSAAKNEKINVKPGYYYFEVTGFERKRYEGSNKLPPSPMALLTLRLATPDGPATVTDRLILADSLEWKIASFFESIGNKPNDGGTVNIDWDDVLGRSGAVKIKNREYNGETYADVAEYMSPYCKNAEEVACACEANRQKR